jgi:hypothetical protein
MNGGPFTVIAGSDMSESPAINEDGLWDFRITTPDARVREMHQELTRAANSTNVSIYALDPSRQYDLRGIGTSAAVQPGVSDDGSPTTGGGAGALGSDEMLWALDMMRDELRNAASETGGKSFIAWSDLDQALIQIEQDSARFYLLTYEPPLPAGDGEYHEIKVEVNRPGVAVRARSGYVDDPREERLDRLVSAALALPGTVEGLPVDLEAFRLWGSGDELTLMLAAALTSSAVRTSVRADGKLGASLRIHVRVLDEEGEVAAEADDDLTAQLRDAAAAGGVAARSGGGAGRARAAAEDATGASGGAPITGFVAYRRGWPMQPGTYDVRVAIIDEVAGNVGAAQLEVEIPEEIEGWRTSDLMLIRTEEEAGNQPIVQGRFESGQSIGALLEVRDGTEPALSGEILSPRGYGEEDTPWYTLRTIQTLTPVRLRAVGPGIHRGGIELPRDLMPGRYLLHVVVSDDPAGQEKTFEVPLEVLQAGDMR